MRDVNSIFESGTCFSEKDVKVIGEALAQANKRSGLDKAPDEYLGGVAVKFLCDAHQALVTTAALTRLLDESQGREPQSVESVDADIRGALQPILSRLVIADAHCAAQKAHSVN